MMKMLVLLVLRMYLADQMTEHTYLFILYL